MWGLAFMRKIVETDDPRWIENGKNLVAMYDTEDDSALEFINIEPTTLAGAAFSRKRSRFSWNAL